MVIQRKKQPELMESVDLGLSVKCANMNFGATSIEEADRLFEKGSEEIMRWKLNSSSFPTIADFEELIEKCWKYEAIVNGVRGKYFIGPNRNSIFLPYSGDGLQYPGQSMPSFGLLGTKEGLNYSRKDNQLMYYNDLTAKIVDYTVSRNCPIRLISRY